MTDSELILIERNWFGTRIAVSTGGTTTSSDERKAITRAVYLLEGAAREAGRAGESALRGAINRLKGRL